MPQSDIFSGEEAKKRLEQLPQDVRGLIYSADMTNRVRAIGEKYHLHVDQIGILESETLFLMLGLTNQVDFPNVLAKRLPIESASASSITKDVYEQLLLPIRESLKKMYPDTTDPVQGREPVAAVSPTPVATPAPMAAAIPVAPPIPAVTTPATPPAPVVTTPTAPTTPLIEIPVIQNEAPIPLATQLAGTPVPPPIQATPASTPPAPAVAPTPTPEPPKEKIPVPPAPPKYETDPYREPVE